MNPVTKIAKASNKSTPAETGIKRNHAGSSDAAGDDAVPARRRKTGEAPSTESTRSLAVEKLQKATFHAIGDADYFDFYELGKDLGAVREETAKRKDHKAQRLCTVLHQWRVVLYYHDRTSPTIESST